MEVKKIFVALSALFLLSCYFGYLLAEIYPEYARREIEIMKEFLKNFSSQDIHPLVIFTIIVLNNSIKSFVAMVLGILLGVAPILFVMINGTIIGIFAKIFGDEIGTTSFVLKILPHGILEIPAVILASSYGVWLGSEFLRDRKNIDKHLRFAANKFVKIVLPMLIIAAMIETYLIVTST
ncbi:MAG: stage II sporulation protein M [Archaeoglobaceae archaeon]